MIAQGEDIADYWRATPVGLPPPPLKIHDFSAEAQILSASLDQGMVFVSNTGLAEPSADIQTEPGLSDVIIGESSRQARGQITVRDPPLSQPVLEVLDTIPKDNVWLSDQEDSSVLNRLKASIEDYTLLEWNWWPLQPRMRALRALEQRLFWICVSISTI